MHRLIISKDRSVLVLAESICQIYYVSCRNIRTLQAELSNGESAILGKYNSEQEVQHVLTTIGHWLLNTYGTDILDLSQTEESHHE